MSGRALATVQAAGHGTNYTAITIVLGILLIVGGVIATIVASYYRLQSHRADAVAMAQYRKLAEEAVANQQELREQLVKLTEKVQVVEQLMRDVG
jgi:L-amino acid N-acyltransferase YncA